MVNRSSKSLIMSDLLSTEQYQRLLEQVERCLAQAEAFAGHRFPHPQISCKQRGQIAGSYWSKDNSLRFNPLIYRDNQHPFLSEVVPHEVAHWLVFHQFGRVAPHGPAWQQVMRQCFQLSPRRTHQLDVSAVQGPTYRYGCLCVEPHQLSLRRHLKVLRGARYRCRACNAILVFEPPTT